MAKNGGFDYIGTNPVNSRNVRVWSVVQPRIIVCGDVHGCLEEFDELLAKIQYQRGKDRLVLCGDLIDRGPDGVGVIRRAQEIGAESLLGNHDHAHIRWRKHIDAFRYTGKKIPMRFSEERARENAALSGQDIEWLRSLPRIIFLANDWVAVHAGFEPRPIQEQNQDTILHLRFVDRDTHKSVSLGPDLSDPPNSRFWTEVWQGPESVIFGHAVHITPTVTCQPVDPPWEVVFRKNWPTEAYTIAIDTGVPFGGSLSCVISEDGFKTWEFESVKAKRTYREVPGGILSMGRLPPRPM